MPKPWIGLVGKAQSGKSTVGLYLVERYGYNAVAFADPLRAMAEAINPIVGFHNGLRYNEAVSLYGYESAKSNFPEVRRFLQALGTEAGRDVLGETVWVDAAVRRAQELGNPCVFTDARFPNEADAVRANGGVILHVVRPSLVPDPSVDAHPSESLQESILADATVYNARSFLDLYDEVDRKVARWFSTKES
jgi:hypothetical protein